MEKKLFLVWYDPEVKEVLNVEKQFATKPLLAQLSKEGVEVCEVYEENLKAANKVFLERFETLKPNVNIMPPNRDMLSINEDSPESTDFEVSSLDETLDRIEFKARKSLKPKRTLH